MGYNVEQEKEKNTLGNLLSAARKNKNLKQIDVCDRLKAYGATISQSALEVYLVPVLQNCDVIKIPDDEVILRFQQLPTTMISLLTLYRVRLKNPPLV